MPEDQHETDKYSTKIQALVSARTIPYVYSKSLGADATEALLATKPHVVLIVGWRSLLSQRIYEVPPMGAWAAHDSNLPSYRGFAPLNWAVINGEKRTGVTLFKVDGGMDTGLVIGRKSVSIKKTETAPQVYEKVIAATNIVVTDALDRLENGTLSLARQNQAAATYTCPRIPDDGCIDWSRPAIEIDRLIRALAPPYPGAFSFHGGSFFRVISGEMPKRQLKYVGIIPGRPVKIHKEVGVEVLTGDGTIIIKEIMTEDGTVMTADKLIRSTRSTLGLSLLELYRLIRSRGHR